MTIVDRWRRENSRWRPFAQVEKSRKIAVEAVSQTPSRLVTSESRLLKKKSFWSPSVKNLVSGLESTRTFTRSRLLSKFNFWHSSVIFSVSGHESTLLVLRVDSWRKIFLPTFCDLRLRVGSSTIESRLLKNFCTNHSSVKNLPQARSRFFNLRVDSWRSTLEHWSSDTPPIRPETCPILLRTCVH